MVRKTGCHWYSGCCGCRDHTGWKRIGVLGRWLGTSLGGVVDWDFGLVVDLDVLDTDMVLLARMLAAGLEAVRLSATEW